MDPREQRADEGRNAPLRRLGALLLVVAALLSAACGGGEIATTALADLEGVDELRAQFNRETGSPRVVLLLSPT
jgi:hypothetical protein